MSSDYDALPPYLARPPQPKEPNGLAVAAFVLALIPLGVTWLIAFGLAIPALRRARKENAKGEGLAVAALVISIVMLVLTTAVVGGIVYMASQDPRQPPRDETGAVSERTVVDIEALRTGDCFGEGGGSFFGNDDYLVPALPCDEPHQYEVYAVFDVDGGDVEDVAAEECAQQLADYIHQTREASQFDYGYLYPSGLGWLLGDRGVICVVYEVDEGLLTGSLAVAGR